MFLAFKIIAVIEHIIASCMILVVAKLKRKGDRWDGNVSYPKCKVEFKV